MGEGQSQEAAANKYTFGDNLRASARLRRLAETYEPESRELLRRSGIHAPRLAVDLGWSTRLLHDVLKPGRTVGLDASLVFVEEARTRQGADRCGSIIDFSNNCSGTTVKRSTWAPFWKTDSPDRIGVWWRAADVFWKSRRVTWPSYTWRTFAGLTGLDPRFRRPTELLPIRQPPRR